ncbi:hypothetical protein [Nocardioides sp.]|uniref:hypothetical protein n=1 Tax=Nocardioides sp. TaxID=35761 RepID=UPI00272AA820|nr:hypothetical protein [Nocardioides sp.]
MTSTVIALAAAALVVTAPAPAQADVSGSGGNNSYGLAVNVVVKGGPGDPVSGGSISISVPPKCWWVPFDTGNFSYYPEVDPNAPDAMAQYFEAASAATTITFVAWRLSIPSAGYLASHQGPGFSWYTLQSAPGVNCADEGYTPAGGHGPEGWAPGSGNIPVSYAAFPGADPAPPLVDVEDVVEEVWDAASAEVLGPDLGRNPQIKAIDGATLVNLPTWFWVQNVEEALAGDGKIHLDVSIPGTPVRATLDAATDGVQVTSPVGANKCSVAEAMTEYSSGAGLGSACTVVFDRSNTAGWTVTGQTTWQGSWQGTDADGPVGGTLQTLTPSASINVPVAQSEAIVTDVD